MNHITFVSILIAFSSWGFGGFVWFKGPRKKVHALWALTCLVIGLWSLGFGVTVGVSDFGIALWWNRYVSYLGAIFIPVVYFHFVLVLLNRTSPRLVRAGYGTASLLLLVNFSGNLISVAPFPPFAFFTTAYPLFHGFTLYFIVYAVLAHGYLYDAMQESTGMRKNQLRFIFWGTAVGFAGGSTTFFMVYDLPIVPYGVYAVLVYIPMVSYAIFRHQLMDIHIVVRRALLYSALSTVLITVYIVLITLLTRHVEGFSVTRNLYASAAAAGVLAFLFDPVRKRLQARLERPAIAQEVGEEFLHELKTPLSSISLPAEMSILDLEDVLQGRASAQDLLPRVQKRLLHIIEQAFLANSRVEAVQVVSGPDKDAYKPVHLPDIINRSQSALEEMLQAARVTVEVSFPSGWPAIQGDPRQLEIVMSNVMKNSVEAMANLPETHVRRLRIRGTVTERELHVEFSDTGPGIPAELRDRIFIPYVSTKGTGGKGIGLALARQIMRLHGGQLSLIPGSTSGALFRLQFPKR